MSIECECGREIPHDVITGYGYVDGEDYETMIEILVKRGYKVLSKEVWQLIASPINKLKEAKPCK